MNIGHCQDCRWWDTTLTVPGRGTCLLTIAVRSVFPEHPRTKAHGSSDAELVRDEEAYLITEPDFGCIQYETKP